MRTYRHVCFNLCEGDGPGLRPPETGAVCCRASVAAVCCWASVAAVCCWASVAAVCWDSVLDLAETSHPRNWFYSKENYLYFDICKTLFLFSRPYN